VLMRIALTVGSGLLVALFILRWPATASAQEMVTVTGDEVVELITTSLEAGPDFDRENLRVVGDIDLRPVRNVERPIRCRNCLFEGDVNASDVQFDAIVHLAGSDFAGDVNLRGALFSKAVVFDDSEFAGTVNLGSARFEDLVSFSRVDFRGAAVLDRVVFNGPAWFPAAFQDPSGEGPCSGINGSFHDRVSAVGTIFNGLADFRQRCFALATDFTSASFSSSADFTDTRYHDQVRFDGVDLSLGASFRIASFRQSSSFQGTTTGGPLDLNGAIFRGDADFTSLTGSGSATFDDVVLLSPEEYPLQLDRLFLFPFSMDLVDVDRIAGPDIQKQVLVLMERSARDAGSTSMANQAQFVLLSKQHDDLSGFRSLIDGVFYRDIAGYLVRPVHPLFTLVVLVVVAGAIRGLHLWKQRETETQAANPRKKVLLSMAERGVCLVEGMRLTLRRAFTLKADFGLDNAGDDSNVGSLVPYAVLGVQWVEFLSYKVLIAVFILGVGNANSTLKELIDSVF
jgi:hypothetical protein